VSSSMTMPCANAKAPERGRGSPGGVEQRGGSVLLHAFGALVAGRGWSVMSR
jgi:hypothetical protein